MIKIIAVGKLKENYFKDAQEEYLKRLKKYTNVVLIEVLDSKIDEVKSSQEEEKERILKHINSKDYIVILDINGNMLTSVDLSKKIDNIFINNSNITFIIGGSYGLHQDIKDKANYSLSFGKLTYPHQLFRVMLLEQIYRSFKIINNEKYHK